MAETQKASTGVKSQVWLEDGPGEGTYTKVHHIKSFTLPKPVREKLESTHLESDAKEYLGGDIDFGEFGWKQNFRPGSDSDLRQEELVASEEEIGVIFCYASRGVLVRNYTGTATVLSYGPDDVERGKVSEAETTLQAVGAFTSSAYVAPTEAP